jgi:hypothetical protein
MTIDLEDRLYRDLPGLAQRADATGLALLDVGTVTARVGQRRRRRVAARVAGVACCALLVVGGLFTLRSGQTGRSSGPQGNGTEEPLTEVPNAAPFAWGVAGTTTPRSVVGVRLADGREVTVSEVAMPSGDGYVVATCIGVGDIGMCAPNARAEPVLGGTSTFSYWTHLPPDAVRVELRTSNSTRWQRPLHGIAAFATTSHSPTDSFVAYDAAGVELARSTWSETSMATSMSSDVNGTQYTETLYFMSPTEPSGALPSMTDEQTVAYLAYAEDTMRACVAADGDAAWTACVQSTDTAVRAYLRHLAEQAPATTSTTTG